jgi:hypothetical protein
MPSGFYLEWAPRMRLLIAGLVTLLLLASAPAAVATLAPMGTPNSGLPQGNSTLDLRVAPTTASVSVNGTAVALASNGSAELHIAPGTYVVAASAPGHRSFLGNVTLRPGQVVYLTVPLPTNSPASASSSGPSSSLVLAVALTIAGGIAVVALLLYVRRTPGAKSTNGTPPPAEVPPSEAARPDEGPD